MSRWKALIVSTGQLYADVFASMTSPVLSPQNLSALYRHIPIAHELYSKRFDLGNDDLSYRFSETYPKKLEILKNSGISDFKRDHPGRYDRLEIISGKKLNIDTFPELPSSLVLLHCVDCNLRQLPRLPATLKTLMVGNNNLENLPELPTSLRFMSIWGNNLTSLPMPLPSALEELYVDRNVLSLSERPPSLRVIEI